MERVLNFLKKAGTFFVATTDGNIPKVRPFSFCMKHDGKLYFTTVRGKASYDQLLENPAVEICALYKNCEWIRIQGKAVFDNSSAALEDAYAIAPAWRSEYRDVQGNVTLRLFYLKEWSATITDLHGKSELILP